MGQYGLKADHGDVIARKADALGHEKRPCQMQG